MVRRVGEPIEVRVRVTGDPGDEPPVAGALAPAAFLWRGRIHVVRAIDGYWRERRAWWREGRPSAAGDRQVWRVRARAGRAGTGGIYELGTDEDTGTWVLLRSHD